MILLTTLFFAFLSISSATTIFKNGVEYTYSYNGHMITGTMDPTEFYSYSNITAEVYVRPVKDDLLIRLANVKYILYSGKETDEDTDTVKEVPIPENAKRLTLPFMYHKYSDDTKDGITTSIEDEPWSRSMKQAIASLLFVDKNVLNDGLKTNYYKDDTYKYFITSDTDSVRIVATKTIKGGKKTAEVVTKKTFDLDKDKETDGNLLLDTVTSYTTYDLNTLNLIGNAFYADVEQTLDFVQAKPFEETELNKENTVYTALNKLNVLHLNSEKTDTEVTDDEMNVLKEDLEKVAKNLDNVHTTTAKVWTDDEQDELNNIIIRLDKLDVMHLNKLYTMLSDNVDSTNLLTQFALLTNSQEAYCFVIGLIEKGKLNEHDAVNVLEKITTNPIIMTDCMKVGLSSLAYDKSTKYNKNVEHQAILALASMVRETSRHADTDTKEIVNDLVKKLKTCKEPNEQSTYVYALLNVDTYETKMELMEIARGKNTEYEHLSPHIRSLAINSLKVGQKNVNLLETLVADGTETFEVRAAALNALFDMKEPLDLVKCFILLKENDDALYHLLYTRLETISENTNSNNKNKAIQAKKLLRGMYPPKITGKAASKIYEMYEGTTGNKLTLEATNYGTMTKDKFISYHLKMTMENIFSKRDTCELYLHLTNGRNEATLIDILSGLTNKNIEREVTLKHDGFVVSIGVFDWKQMMNDIFHGKFERNALKVNQMKNTKVVVPTDMGTSIKFVNYRYCIGKNGLDVSIRETEGNGRFVKNGRYKCVNTYGVGIYNPVVNVWNGIKRTCNMEVRVPLDIKLDSIERSIKWTLAWGDVPFGVQIFTVTKVGVIDEDGDKLKASCPKCNQKTEVTVGKKSNDHKTILEGECEVLGLEYKLTTVGCEQQLSLLNTNDLVGNLKNIKKIQTKTGTCGISLVVGNKKEHPKTHIEIDYVENNDYSTTSDRLIALSVDNMTINYAIKDQDETLKSWNLKYECMDYVRNSSSCELNIIRKKNGETDKAVCYEAHRSYKPDGVETSMMLFSGDVEDGKCSDESSKIIVQRTTTNDEDVPDLNEVFENCDLDGRKTFDDCLREVSAFRVDYWNVTYSKLNQNHLKIWNKISDFVRTKYANNFYRVDKYDNAEDFVDIAFRYPVHRHGLDVAVTTESESYGYKDLKFPNFVWKVFLNPFSGLRLSDECCNNYCNIDLYSVSNKDGIKRTLKYEEDWTDLASQCNDEGKCGWSVKTKKANDNPKTLVLKFETGGDVVEVTKKEDFEIKLNGESLKLNHNILTRVTNMVDILVLSQDGVTKRVIVHGVPNLLNVEYTPERMRMSSQGYSQGQC